MTTATSNLSQTDLSRFGALRLDAKQDPDAAMKKVAREFEALFIQMMLKAAREAGGQDGMFDNNESRMYHEMFDDQVALSMADKGSLGMEAMLRRQFAGQLPNTSDGDTASSARQLPARRSFAIESLPVAGAAAAANLPELTKWPTDNTSDVGDSSTVDAMDGARKRFADSIREPAARAAAKLGTTPDILIAQAALETGWGKHVMTGPNGQSSHNLFSIKADPSWDGDTVTRRTLEYMQGRQVKISAGFRAYNGLGQAFDDYVDFIAQNPRYQRALEKAADPRAYVQELQRAGYATDPHYAQKILQIHNQVAAAGSDSRG